MIAIRGVCLRIAFLFGDPLPQTAAIRAENTGKPAAETKRYTVWIHMFDKLYQKSVHKLVVECHFYIAINDIMFYNNPV
jgi:hypothetical protein